MRCNGCGFLPRLQVYDEHFPQDVQTDGLSEGAFVLERASSVSGLTSASLPMERDVQTVHRPAPPATHDEPVPLSNEKPGLWVLFPILPLALTAIAILILVVLPGLK